jgi:hypothetical protein
MLVPPQSQGGQTVARATPDSFYNILVVINDQSFNGYIDTGSQVNVAHISVAEKLDLKLNTSDLVVKGFGNSFVIPKGMCELPVKIGTVSISTPVLFVQTEMKNYDT